MTTLGRCFFNASNKHAIAISNVRQRIVIQEFSVYLSQFDDKAMIFLDSSSNENVMPCLTLHINT